MRQISCKIIKREFGVGVKIPGSTVSVRELLNFKFRVRGEGRGGGEQNRKVKGQ